MTEDEKQTCLQERERITAQAERLAGRNGYGSS
jgi:hypothetical protein